MPAPKKAEEKVPPPEPEKKASEAPSEPQERDAPPAPPPKASKAKDAPKLPKIAELRPREWFDYILPNAKGEGFFGGFPRTPKPKDEE